MKSRDMPVSEAAVGWLILIGFVVYIAYLPSLSTCPPPASRPLQRDLACAWHSRPKPHLTPMEAVVNSNPFAWAVGAVLVAYVIWKIRSRRRRPS